MSYGKMAKIRLTEEDRQSISSFIRSQVGDNVFVKSRKSAFIFRRTIVVEALYKHGISKFDISKIIKKHHSTILYYFKNPYVCEGLNDARERFSFFEGALQKFLIENNHNEKFK